MTLYHTDTFFTIKSKELYEKMQYEYEKLIKDMSPYNIFDFFVTAYHLKDYIKNEFGLNKRDDIRAFENMDELLDMAGFIANKGKHFDVNNSNYTNMETRFYSGKVDGTMLYDGAWKIGEGETYKILNTNSEVVDVKIVAKELLDGWKMFIENRDLF